MRPFPSATLWRLFWVLAGLQLLDLVTTYRVIGSGGREGNLLMRAVILTPMAPLLKAFALVFLALLILGSRARGRPAPHRLIIVSCGLVAIYVLIVMNNVANLLFAR